MSQQGEISAHGIRLRVFGVVVVVLLAALAGFWLGNQSVRLHEEAPPRPQVVATPTADAIAEDEPQPPPLFLFTSAPEDTGGAVAEQVAMAAHAGIHQYVLPVALPWDAAAEGFLAPLDVLLGIDPAATVLLYVTLDPPPAWLDAHPDQAAQVAGKRTGQVCIASQVWLRDVQAALGALIEAAQAAHGERVLGYVAACLHNGRWHRRGPPDASPVNTAAFRSWLRARYRDADALQKARNDPDQGFDHAAVPPAPDAPEGGPVFLELPQMQPHLDYRAFASDSTAEAIMAVTDYIKRLAGPDVQVIVPYGDTFEIPRPASGHLALARLLESDLDGFAGPVSAFDRGLGGAGGLIGPVDSAALHGKQWYLIDDTRTGIALDTATGHVARPKNIRAEDIYSVQQRNFAVAVTHGLGLVWADPEGTARLHDPEMWQRFGAMHDIYTMVNTWELAQVECIKPYPSIPMLNVVVDEASQLVVRGDGKLDQVLLRQVRDCALRVGVPTRFYLLSDVLELEAPPAPAYLFLNAFRLTTAQRTRLHAMLEHNKAAAIWMYAPGYIDGLPAVANIAATTRMTVKAFDGPAETGSVCLLPGKWVNEAEAFGAKIQLEPLFYIDDPDADVIAKYAASDKASVAVHFFETGWASIYCAEPSLTPALLRELLSILEIPISYQPTPTPFYDTVHFGPNLMAIHAKNAGERAINLGEPCDVQDLLAPEVGWPRKRTFDLPLNTGSTRLLQLIPLETEQIEPPEELALEGIDSNTDPAYNADE